VGSPHDIDSRLQLDAHYTRFQVSALQTGGVIAAAMFWWPCAFHCWRRWCGRSANCPVSVCHTLTTVPVSYQYRHVPSAHPASSVLTLLTFRSLCDIRTQPQQCGSHIDIPVDTYPPFAARSVWNPHWRLPSSRQSGAVVAPSCVVSYCAIC
jgi:hypothetical protein